MIGLDGATFDLLEPWIEEGKLPNMRRVIEESSYGRLESTIPPLSPVAWTTLVTGVNSGKHGIFDFTWVEPHTFQQKLINSRDVRSKRIWDFVEARGKRSIIINVPVTFPPEKIAGIMISGIPVPIHKPSTYPEGVEEDLKRQLGLDLADMNGELLRRIDDRVVLEGIYRVTESRFKMASHLLKKDWDLFVTVFMEPDKIQHLFWNQREEILLPYYQRLDNLMGSLLAEMEDGVYKVILSDHGMGPAKINFFLNTFLKDQGLLASRKKRGNQGFDVRNPLKGNPASGSRKTWLRNVFQFFNRRDQETDWKRTKAYFINTGQIRGISINLKGREPQGIVSPQEYEALRDRIISQLAHLQDGRFGPRIFDEIFRREEIYSGPFVDGSPDIVFTSHHEYVINDEFTRALVKVRKDVRGMHRSPGIFIINGPSIQKGKKLLHPHILDMAPTLLFLLGVPVPRSLEGKVLTEIFDPDYIGAHPVRYDDGNIDVSLSRIEIPQREAICKGGS